MTSAAILTTIQMYEADQLAIDGGISGLELMENAGQGVAAHIEQGWDPCPVTILCGPGNNGGDGYVVARSLSEAGWSVQVLALNDPDTLHGDALEMYRQFDGDVEILQANSPLSEDLIVDALFGAGFKGELPSVVRAVFEKVQLKNTPVVAIDVSSGIDGTTGEIAEGTPHADLTVSFFKAKLGHLLYPARQYLGLLEIIDIGIPEEVLKELGGIVFENNPDLWIEDLPQPNETGHKYSRGHAAVTGGGISATGAARIAARAALRSGSGAVTVVSPPSALSVYAHTLEAVMVSSVAEKEAFGEWLDEKRIHAVLLGPGNGATERTRDFVETALERENTVILDADALTIFKDDPKHLFEQIKVKPGNAVILTPHEAEFCRLFKEEGPSVERARKAAQKSGAIILLKGASTVIANPSGQVIINTNAAPWLATAGSGDALAGIIMGLVSAGMDSFLATAAAAWIHGEAALRRGRGMIAEDIEKEIPYILQWFDQYLSGDVE